MKLENLGEIFVDGRIIGLDNTSTQDIDNVLKQLNTQEESIMNRLNIALSEIQ